MKNGKIYMKLNSFSENIPIFIVFKALGIESEQVSYYNIISHFSLKGNFSINWIRKTYG